MSSGIQNGPGEGSWSVFAGKVVEERDALEQKLAEEREAFERKTIESKREKTEELAALKARADEELEALKTHAAQGWESSANIRRGIQAILLDSGIKIPLSIRARLYEVIGANP